MSLPMLLSQGPLGSARFRNGSGISAKGGASKLESGHGSSTSRISLDRCSLRHMIFVFPLLSQCHRYCARHKRIGQLRLPYVADAGLLVAGAFPAS